MIRTITDANIFINGKSYLGKAEEVELPAIKHKTIEVKGLGMIGELEAAGGIEKMEVKIKWGSYYPEVMEQLMNPYKSVQVMIRASSNNHNSKGVSEQVPVVCTLTAIVRESSLGSIKSSESLTQETTLSVSAYKLEMNNRELVNIDLWNNIYKINGEDLLAKHKQNLGI